MSEQAQKVKNKNVPEWAEGLYYSSGLMKEVLVYHDDESMLGWSSLRSSQLSRYEAHSERPAPPLGYHQ
jgi:hypothetical protein